MQTCIGELFPNDHVLKQTTLQAYFVKSLTPKILKSLDSKKKLWPKGDLGYLQMP